MLLCQGECWFIVDLEVNSLAHQSIFEKRITFVGLKISFEECMNDKGRRC